ncbi:hypothetical protein R9C00_24365 [Flammeovirgaceae bacterium SG7u.111]|nr:hypothetical protein [Flammeovirgaceae bacterium SG7u.132]WPO34837.1 hypothetical protein R9C00_24365 [Flammeovirgaceae bacterium SG7u.111]
MKTKALSYLFGASFLASLTLGIFHNFNAKADAPGETICRGTSGTCLTFPDGQVIKGKKEVVEE